MENSIIEIWQAVPGYEGLYEASDLGNVRSLNYKKTGEVKVLSPGICGSGYLSVVLCKNGKTKKFLVQRLIYSVFKGPIPDGMQVDHLNNIKTDNRLENLQLLTPPDNTRKAHKGKKHTEHTKAKMSEAKKGKPRLAETKAKIAASRKGKKLSAETKAKMCASQKARREREKNLE